MNSSHKHDDKLVGSDGSELRTSLRPSISLTGPSSPSDRVYHNR